MVSRIFKNTTALVIGSAFILWFILFRHFIFNQLPLTDDAVAYFLHTRFFLLNLESGTYPLWDPDWFAGAPVDFFLRRIGNFNPFYLLIVIFHKIGIPFRIAYLLFLVLYFYLGMAGFYLLARTLIKDARAALGAFLLLCFSSLGAMLFFSFLHLVYVPLFWFFYLLIKFFSKPSRSLLLGLTFTAMIIVSTYIPFYVFIILSAFILFFVPFYFQEARGALIRVIPFVFQNKLAAILCAVVLAAACLPQVILFKTSTEGQVVLPSRHKGSPEQSIYTVDAKKVAGADAFSQLYFDRLIRDHDKMELGVVYFPVAGFLIFLLGLFTRLDKRTVFLSLMAFFLFLIAITELSPVHGFLYKYVFGLKFIRQSYFFFWIAILPILALIAGVQLEKLLACRQGGRLRVKIGAVSAVFVLSLMFLFKAGNVSAATLVTLILGAGLSSAIILSSRIKALAFLDNKPNVLLLAIFVLIAMDPADTFRHIRHNEERTPPGYSFKEDEASAAMQYKDPQLAYERDRASVDRYFSREKDEVSSRPPELYYVSDGYDYLFQHSDYTLFRYYLNHRFALYDDVQHIKKQALTPERIEMVLSFKDNRAIIEDERAIHEHGTSPHGRPEPITAASGQFQVLNFTANSLTASADMASPKFLVYNDSYHKDWQVTVNGQRRELYLANAGFKGLWLPAGKSTVVFSFAPKARYIFDFMLAAVFLGVFISSVIVYVKETRSASSKAAL